MFSNSNTWSLHMYIFTRLQLLWSSPTCSIFGTRQEYAGVHLGLHSLSSCLDFLSLHVPPPLQYAVALFVALSPSGLLWSPAAVWASNMFERCAPTPQRVPSSSSNKKVQRLTAAFRCHLLQALLSVKRPFRWHNNWSLKWNIDDINPQMCSVSVMLLSVATVKDLHNFIQF